MRLVCFLFIPQVPSPGPRNVADTQVFVHRNLPGKAGVAEQKGYKPTLKTPSPEEPPCILNMMFLPSWNPGQPGPACGKGLGLRWETGAELLLKSASH